MMADVFVTRQVKRRWKIRMNKGKLIIYETVPLKGNSKKGLVTRELKVGFP